MTFPKVPRAIKVGIALLLFVGLSFIVSPLDLFREFASISLVQVALLILISIALVWVSAAKWRLFLGPEAPSTWRLFRLYLIGYFVNSLVPSYVGGDAARSYLAGKDMGQVAAASATILERYTGLVAMFGLGVLSCFAPAIFAIKTVVVPLPVRLAVLGLALGLAVASVAVLWAPIFNILQRILPVKLATISARVRISLIGGLSNRRVVFEAAILSLIYHSLTVLNTAVAAQAIGWNTVPIGDLFIVLPIILTIGGLPITPSGLGIQEGAFVYFLSLLGASRPESLAVGLLLRAKTYLLALVGWGCFVVEQRKKGSSIDPLDASLISTSTGTGRANMIIVTDRPIDNASFTLLAEYKITTISVATNFDTDIWNLVELVERRLETLSIRSGIFVGIGDATSLVQALTLRCPKLVRMMVLIDATSRPHPTRWLRAIARIESFLPLGLPFRHRSTGFNALPLAHRLRSPCVVAVSGAASAYQHSEALVLAARLPTAILLELGATVEATIEAAIAACVSLPARCPQKNKGNIKEATLSA